MTRVKQEEEQNWGRIRALLLARETELTKELMNFASESKQFQEYLVSYKGEIDPHEMFTNSRLQEQQQLAESISFQQLEKIRRQKQNPYFTRVDFLFAGERMAEEIYIGRSSFSTKEHELIIYDWRAPIAGIFYDFDIGPASYLAPNGKVHGEITKKRQVKFLDGKIDYVLESGKTVFDDVLQKELSNQSGGQMSAIISTIQTEQNAVIRNTHVKNLIIQGVAGSGKTSIALHRIAFLLYHYREELSSEEILIISPNKVFGSFIAQVLPELGEEPIREWTIDAFAVQFSLTRPAYSRIEEVELSLDADITDKKNSYLGSVQAGDDLQQFLEELDQTAFVPQPLIIGEYVFDEHFLNTRFQAYKRQSVTERLRQIAAEIIEELKLKPFRPSKMPTVTQIKTKLLTMYRFRSFQQIYRAFLERAKLLESRSYSYSELFPLIYSRMYFEGIELAAEIRYLIIDEMQDYTPIQYMVFNKLFKCPKLLVGDYTQQLNEHNEMSIAQLTQIFPDTPVVHLTKSYRSTYEIMRFAKQIIDDQIIEPVLRHGEQPKIIHVATIEEELNQICLLIEQLGEKSGIALITKTNKQAEFWYTKLVEKGLTLSWLKGSEEKLTDKQLIICSVGTSKGLEFDAVIAVEASAANYPGAIGKQQLFVIATRAMHRLYFIQRGE
ncbi:HelD family protein [Enterococcus sp. LJL128]|uniref:HelD family protein n=1 Tax=Enterococcus sp. LJL51 TaxID=3416656 RepID=UPI003CF2B023